MKVEKKNEYLQLMENDLGLFGRVIVPEMLQSTDCILHRDIQDMHIKRPRFAAIIAPRSHGKTIWASTIGTVHDVAYDREDVIVLIKKTFELAVKDLFSIINIIKYNPQFHYFFGKYEFLVDRQERIYLLNPRTGHKTWLEVRGYGQSIRGIVINGKRLTKGLLDDFEDENNTATLLQRQQVGDWIAAQVLPSLDTKIGHLLAIGTIVHYDSWLNNLWQNYRHAIDNNEKTSWHVIFHQMIEDGKTIWPEKFTTDYIGLLRETYSNLNKINKFYQEYMNIPFDREDLDFKKTSIRYYDGYLSWDKQKGHQLHISAIYNSNNVKIEGESIKSVYVIAGYDLAGGESSGYTGRNVLCIDSDGYRYDEVAERVHFKPDKLKEMFFDDYIKYRPNMMIIEKEAHGRIMSFWMREAMREKGLFLPLRPEPIYTRQSKEDKLREALQPLYAGGIMTHKKGQIESEEELFTFPKGKYTDILDAKYLANKYARRPGVVTSVLTSARKKKRIMYDWMTGARAA